MENLSSQEQEAYKQAVAGQALTAATTELEFRVDILNKMVANCYDKCASRPFKEGSLSVGEISCADRCATKYWQVVAIVGQMLGGTKKSM
ncbi:hypothetical protein FOA52_001572 [Chlamydomonas sp. UWO 241]|nr:hypothetical protein FOA52_001572 [Chlamydomonas sp. UWO 241]